MAETTWNIVQRLNREMGEVKATLSIMKWVLVLDTGLLGLILSSLLTIIIQ